MLELTVQRPGEGPAILNAYRELVSNIDCDRSTGLFAFATYRGASVLTAALAAASRKWREAPKRWVISVDGGVTEPGALRFLLAGAKSEVYVPDAELLLSRGLVPANRFHPKTLLLERRRRTWCPIGLLVGSANLTFNGLCCGHEHALVSRPRAAAGKTARLPASVEPGLESIEIVIAGATRIDMDFVDRYEQIRPARPRPPREVENQRANLILGPRAVLDSYLAAALASTNNFWIDVEYVVANRGRAEEGNQLDLQRGTRVFFGFPDETLPRNSPIGTVRIIYGAHAGTRNLRFGNNQMDKLDLPIPGAEGPPTYANQTLLFTRKKKGTYLLTVGSTAQASSWRRLSEARGTLFRMRSGRAFGVF
jgi:HKD family nuclease